MEHLGIDLGATQSALCIVSSDGTVVLERTLRTGDLEAFLARRPPARVAVESCAESRLVALRARAQGHEVRVVPTSLVRALGVGTRRIKTDKRDARHLAMASFRLGDELPQVHVRSDEDAALQDLVRSRALLVRQRTMTINFVRAQLRKALLGRGPRCTSDVFATRVRALLGDRLSLELEVHLQMLETLQTQLDQLNAKMKAMADTHKPAQRLQAIPGVGPIISLAFLAAVADPARFASGRHLASYLGLSPGERSSGGATRRTGIIGAGQRQVRSLLVQGAHVMLNARTRTPMAQWAHELQLRRGRKVAVCALARRLAVVMWAMLRDGTVYDSARTASKRQGDPSSADRSPPHMAEALRTTA